MEPFKSILSPDIAPDEFALVQANHIAVPLFLVQLLPQPTEVVVGKVAKLVVIHPPPALAITICGAK